MYLALIATLVATMPNIPETATLEAVTACIDKESEQKGDCFIFTDTDGSAWMMFSQKGTPKFLRYIEKGQPYINVWVDQRFNSF